MTEVDDIYKFDSHRGNETFSFCKFPNKSQITFRCTTSILCDFSLSFGSHRRDTVNISTTGLSQCENKTGQCKCCKIMSFKRYLWHGFQHILIGFFYIAQRIFHKYRSPDNREDEEDVEGKVVVITGANSGLGKALAYQMAKRGAMVVMACRDIGKTGRVIEEIKRDVPDAFLMFVKLDLEDMKSVRSCAARITSQVLHINILICNAGVFFSSPVIQRTKDGFERNLACNHLGHFLLTNLLLGLLKKGAPSRIVVVSSSVHLDSELNISDLNLNHDQFLGFFNLRPYNSSKHCNALFARELCRRVEKDGINVYGLCPGLVDTELFSGVNSLAQAFFYGSILLPILGCTPEQGVETVLYCALSKECAAETGRMYRFRKYWKEADEKLDDELAAKLWDVSERLVGLGEIDTCLEYVPKE